MINRKQTAQTFRFYLGKEVLVVFPNGSNEMQVLTGRFYDDVIVDSLEYHKDYKVYPILKTVDEGITPKNINFLIDNEYGAIPSTESHTGYVDLFGMPCVTQKQVEKGVFKHE
jgi:hypothetical protein